MSGPNLLADLGFTDPVGCGAVQGEVVEFNGQSITIVGPFAPSDALQLRPGARVVVLVEDALDEATKVPANLLAEAKSSLMSSLSDARTALDDIEDALDELKT